MLGEEQTRGKDITIFLPMLAKSRVVFIFLDKIADRIVDEASSDDPMVWFKTVSNLTLSAPKVYHRRRLLSNERKQFGKLHTWNLFSDLDHCAWHHHPRSPGTGDFPNPCPSRISMRSTASSHGSMLCVHFQSIQERVLLRELIGSALVGLSMYILCGSDHNQVQSRLDSHS